MAFLNGPLDTGDVIATYSYASVSPGEPMISMVFLRALLSAVSCFPMRSARPRDARDVQVLRGVQEDDQDTHHRARDLRRLRDARGARRVRDGSSIFKCPEVGSYFLLLGAFSKTMSSSCRGSSSRPSSCPRRRSRVRTRRSKFRSRGPPGNVPFRASPGGLRKRPKWLRGSPGPNPPRNDRSVNRNSNRIGPPPKSENLASPRRILERRNVAVVHTP